MSLGVEVVDVKIRSADLPAANSQAIYQRMQTERQRQATEIRAQGEQAARRIRAEADRTATVIVAEATGESERLRGDGEAEQNRILSRGLRRRSGLLRLLPLDAGLSDGPRRLGHAPGPRPGFRVLPLLQQRRGEFDADLRHRGCCAGGGAVSGAGSVCAALRLRRHPRLRRAPAARRAVGPLGRRNHVQVTWRPGDARPSLFRPNSSMIDPLAESIRSALDCCIPPASGEGRWPPPYRPPIRRVRALAAATLTAGIVAFSAPVFAKGPESVADLAAPLLDAVVNISTSQTIAGAQGRAGAETARRLARSRISSTISSTRRTRAATGPTADRRAGSSRSAPASSSTRPASSSPTITSSRAPTRSPSSSTTAAS